MRRLGWLLLAVGCAHVDSASAPGKATVRFERHGQLVAELDGEALRRAGKLEKWEAFDPYYQRLKRWWTVPLAPLLRAHFTEAELSSGELLLKATDGYAVPLRAEFVAREAPYLAVADADGAWEPIGPQRANPGPYYVVWRGETQQELATHPRPWSLASIGVVRFEDVFPRLVPPSESETINTGYDVFRSQCIRCHAINRQGGRVGPDLNVPQNITEYRPAEQIRAYIKDPTKFRYGAMPPHLHLSEAQLDGLMAYLKVMASKKIDDDAKPNHP